MTKRDRSHRAIRVWCLVAVAAVLMASCTPASGTSLTGTVLDASPAPDFTLTDGLTGKSIALSSLHGSVVALAFLYTHCLDQCPLTAAKFAAAQKALGSDAERARFVAVSVDPLGDTPDRITKFSEDHGLTRDWYYLVGTHASLAPVWSSYGVGAFSGDAAGSVTHSDAIYLIDPEGRERALVHSDVVVTDLVSDLRALLR